MHLGHSCRSVMISDWPFPCQCQTSLITAEKLTRCDVREVKFEFHFDLGCWNFVAVNPEI